MPLTLGGASGPKAAAPLLPFFLTPSVGGGIKDGIPPAVEAAGVVCFESDDCSAFMTGAAGSAAAAAAGVGDDVKAVLSIASSFD